MTQIEINRGAIEKFKETYPDLEGQFKKDMGESINFLRLLGFKCANCAGSITANTLRFCDYSQATRCWDCQNNNK